MDNATENCDIQDDEKQSQPTTAKMVSNSLLILLDPRMDREPEEFYHEQELLRLHRQREPDYSKAALYWPQHAAQHWTTVGPLVTQLFSKRFNFMHWVLEFARERHPEIYGTKAPTNNAILDLVQALYDGSLTPLHMSAALGFDAICLELMESPFTAVGSSSEIAASPLFYALAGPQIFACGSTSTSKWLQQSKHVCRVPELLSNWQLECEVVSLYKEMHIHHPYFHGRMHDSCFHGQMAIIRRLLQLHKQGRILFEKTGPKARLLMVLAFQASIITGEPIVLQVLQGGSDAQCLISLINAQVYLCDSLETSRSGQIIIGIFDLLLAPSQLGLPEDVRLDLINAIESAIASVSPEVAALDMPEPEFHEALKSAFLDGSTASVKRLATHPCFDANAPTLTRDGGGTLLHHAVCDGFIDIAEVLINAGSDLEARDDEGRTPLLVCDDMDMATLLVGVHGADLGAIDNEGRNLWHYVVETSDASLFAWLVANDWDMPENLAVKTKAAQTPLDVALSIGLKCFTPGLAMDQTTWKNAVMMIGFLVHKNAPYSVSVKGRCAGVTSYIIERVSEVWTYPPSADESD